MAKPGAIDTEWSPLKAYASRKSGRPWQDILAVVILLIIAIWCVFRASRLPEYDWNWPLLLEFLVSHGKSGLEPGLLTRGLATTFRLGCWIIIFSILMGVPLGFLNAGRSLRQSFPYQIFINIIRNTPPLVILFCVYFFAGSLIPGSGLKNAAITLPPFWQNLVSTIFASPAEMDRMCAATVALGLYQATYVAEIVRGAIESVPAGQWDAGTALGFSRGQCLRLIILPQAGRLLIPPLTGQFITTFKDSALASLISLPDLTFQSLEIMAISGLTFEVWISSAILYLLIGAACALGGRWLEKKYSHNA